MTAKQSIGILGIAAIVAAAAILTLEILKPINWEDDINWDGW